MRYWFLDSWFDYSASWAAVVPFMRYAQNSPGRGRYVKYWSNVDRGDVVMVDWNGAATPPRQMHSAVVTRVDGSPGKPTFDLRLTYHTNNRLHKSLRDLVGANPGATWWAFHLYETL